MQDEFQMENLNVNAPGREELNFFPGTTRQGRCAPSRAGVTGSEI
jgi:hypothetical protein